MTPRVRIGLIVALAALAAAGTSVGVTLATRTPTPRPAKKLSGSPPLELDLGVRTDAQATALRRAAQLLQQHEAKQAAAIFERYRSVDAQIGLAFAEWPQGSPSRELAIADTNPGSAPAQLHLGLALLWNGRPDEAQTAFRQAMRLAPDSQTALSAEDFLHAQYFPGRPAFEPSFAVSPAIARLQPAQQLAVLRREVAADGGVRSRLLYGAWLQRLGRPVSAEKQFAAAAKLAPDDAEAQTAAAVGLFTKANPSRAFSRLGPLAKRFPHAATVRYHLGLMLLWIGQGREGERQLRLSIAAQPGSPLAGEAKRLLARLVHR